MAQENAALNMTDQEIEEIMQHPLIQKRMKKVAIEASCIAIRNSLPLIVEEMERQKIEKRNKTKQYIRKVTQKVLENYQKYTLMVDREIFNKNADDTRHMSTFLYQTENSNEENIYNKLESIRNNVADTKEVLNMIDNAMRAYRIWCETSAHPKENIRRYETLYNHYIQTPPLTVREIAESRTGEENVVCQERIVRRDIKDATDKLVAFLLGVDYLV